MFINKLNAPMSKSIALALFTAASSLVLSSCQDEDYGYTPDQIAYQTNFQKAYGKISEIPTWDLSTYNLKKMGLEGGPSNDHAAIGGAQTRAISLDNANSIFKPHTVSTYNVQSETTDWLNAHLEEKVDHKSLGEAFNLINPYYEVDGCSEFLIIPIYQGASGMTWNLHLVDDQYDYPLWSKSEGFTYTIHHNDWEEFFFRDPSYNTIPLKGAFDGVDSYTDVEVSFMPNTGTMTGRFFVTNADNISNENQRAYITALDNKSFSASGEISDNRVSLKGVIDSYYTTTGGSSIKATKDNIYFEPSSSTNRVSFQSENPQDGNCIYATPYPAERLHVWVKFENPSPEKTENKTLVNFEPSKSLLRPSSGDSNVSYFEGHTINRSNVASKVMKIDASKLGREFSLYLETKYSDQYNQGFSKEGVKHRSNGDPKMMLALHDFSGSGAPIDFGQTLVDLRVISDKDQASNYQYMVIGCEDANGPDSDWDYNDVVLLFVGLPKVPQIATDVVQKRYMIEDLGSTFDFDFNDIVVDVTQEKILNLSTKETTAKQIVSVAHLCGTIPFDVHFKTSGGTESIFGKLMGKNGDGALGGSGFDPKSDNAYKTKYVKEYVGERNFLWDPSANNIVVYVWPDKAGLTDETVQSLTEGNSSLYEENSAINNLLDIKKAQQINFPKPGQFPYIIAVDQDINWMPELHSIPEAWFSTTEIKNKYPDNTDDPGIYVPQKPTQTPDATGYGELISDTYMVNNSDGSTTVNLGNFLTGKYLNPGRDLTFTVVLSSTCLPSESNNHSTAVPEVKGEFALNNQQANEKLYDATINLKDFKSPEGNSNIIIQQFKLLDALTIEEDDNSSLLSVPNAQRLLFNINYATYGFKDVGSGNPQAKLYVSWDKRPALKLTFNDNQETASFTVRQNNKNVQNTNGVYLVDANNPFTIAGNQDCKYLWYKGNTKVGESTGTNAQSGNITIGNTDTELKVDVYHAVVPQMHKWISSNTFNGYNNAEGDFDGMFQPTNDHKITLSWNGTSSTEKLYVPVDASVSAVLTLNTSKFELVGWRWGLYNEGSKETSLTITKSSRDTEWMPQAAIKELDTNPRLTLKLSDNDKSDITSVIVNSNTYTPDNGVVVVPIATGSDIKVQFVHNNTAYDNQWHLKFDLKDPSESSHNQLILNQETTLNTKMPASDMTLNVTCLYQVKVTVAGTGEGSVTIKQNGADTGTTNEEWIAKNTSVVFTTVPNEGSHFSSWSYTPPTTITQTVYLTANFETANTRVEAVVRPSSDYGYVAFKDNKTSATGTDYIEIPCYSDANITMTATPKSGYSFVTWGYGNVNPERTVSFKEDVLTKSYYPVFAKNIGPSYSHGLKNNYDLDWFGKAKYSASDWSNANQTALSGVLSTTNSVIVIYFDDDISAATFTFYYGGGTDTFSPKLVEKRNKMLVADVSNVVENIKTNGFYVKMTGLASDETTINAKQVAIGPNEYLQNP